MRRKRHRTLGGLPVKADSPCRYQTLPLHVGAGQGRPKSFPRHFLLRQLFSQCGLGHIRSRFTGRPPGLPTRVYSPHAR